MAQLEWSQHGHGSSGSQAFKYVHEGTASAKMATGYCSSTHAKVLAAIADDPQFHKDFSSLPSIEAVRFGPGETLPTIFVGYMLCRTTNQWLEIWVEPILKHGEQDLTKLQYILYTPSQYTLVEKCHTDLCLQGPFGRLTSSTATQLWSVVVFYLIEKGHLTQLDITPSYLEALKGACALIANGPTRAMSPPPVATLQKDEETCDSEKSPIQGGDETSDDGEFSDHHSVASLPALSGESGEDEDTDGSVDNGDKIESSSDTDADGACLDKRQREDDSDFAEYQVFMHDMRKQARADNNAEITSLRQKMEELEKCLYEEGVRSVQALDLNSKLQSVNDMQREKIEELERELQCLRDWKIQVKRMFER